jgi:DNA (cytosine-5)-methyltransferase 1
MAASGAVPVIDVFAGPGGLGEGFSAFQVNGKNVFRIALSIEKDCYAHATLRLRSFFRQFAHRRAPEAYYQHLRNELTRDELYARHPAEAERAAQEAWHAELGSCSLPRTSCAAGFAARWAVPSAGY